MPKSIPAKAVLKQLKADLTGKDSYRGVTLTYSWLANQFGHISLGFIPTFIVYIALSKHISERRAANRAVLLVSAAWLAFEFCNLLVPILFKMHEKLKVTFISRRQRIFQPAWKNIAFDTITDLCFFWFGAFFAGVLCHFTFYGLLVVLILAVTLIYPTAYWYSTKMYLQYAQYPFQFRLGQWNFENITRRDRVTINRFINNRTNGMHLFLFGSEKCGKTSLSVGIATEMSIKHIRCLYTTAIKLYSMFFDNNKAGTLDEQALWDWRSAAVIVIDDINTGGPISDIISPGKFLSFIDTFTGNEANRDVLRRANVIWVLGDYDPKREAIDKWRLMLQGIGIKDQNIYEITLVEQACETAMV